MNQFKIVGGKLVASKNTTPKGNAKPAKYAYPADQFDALLKLAKGAGAEIGSSKAVRTKIVNSLTRTVLNEFIATQNKPKSEQA